MSTFPEGDALIVCVGSAAIDLHLGPGHLGK